MFCNNTNRDGVSLHQFPTDEPFWRQWIAFVLAKRDDDWMPGSGNICSSHFMPDCYEGMDAKLTGFTNKAYLKKTAIPTIQANPTPGQIQEALSLKKKTYICGNAGWFKVASSTKGGYNTKKVIQKDPVEPCLNLPLNVVFLV